MTDHVVVLHRWAAPYALYERYIDHRAHRISYVTTAAGVAGVPAGAAGVEVVAATDDRTEVGGAIDRLERRNGPIDTVVALKEDDLLVAARIRVDRGLPGDHPDDLLVFRDKLVMSRAAAAAGESVPNHAAAESIADLRGFGAQYRWPVVVKPRLGSSSAGVIMVEPGDLDTVDLDRRIERLGPHMVQSRADGMLLHVDGVYADRELPIWRAGRYLGTPLGFRQGGWVGSVDVAHPRILRAVHDHTRAIMRGLAGDRPTVFHLETFLTEHAGRYTCAFLEVGARVGGAEIPFLWRDIHGHDLMHTAFGLAIGDRGVLPEPEPQPRDQRELGGLLLIPAPQTRPCVVTRMTPALGTDWAPAELYGQDRPEIGQVISDADAYYEHVGGRYRFRGFSARAVESAIRTVARTVTIEGRPIDVAGASRPAT